MEGGDRGGGVEIIREGRHHRPRHHRPGDFGREAGRGAGERAIEAIELLPCLGERGEGKIELRAIMGLQQQQAHGLARRGGEHIADGEEIAEAFGHLLPVHAEHAVVQPDTGEMAARKGAAALRDLVLMMREEEIRAAAMDVEIGAEMAPGHGAALDMPAGPAAAPGALPARLVGPGGLPEHEIGRVALIGRDLDAGAGDHVLARAAGKPAIGGEARHREEHVVPDWVPDWVPLGTRGDIGVAAGDQALDQPDHLGDVEGRAGLDIGGQRAERRHILMEVTGRAGGEAGDRLARFGGAGDDLVIDIGDVADIGHAGEKAPQQPHQRVEHHHGPGIAEMGEVIDGGTADIDADMRGIEGDEELPPPCHAVVEKEVHPRLSPRRRERTQPLGAAETMGR